jgi:hypothetical protein
MYDPKSVAFDIYLGPKRKKNGLYGQYRDPFITIWHNDPQKRVLGCRPDDSCGWFAPPYTESEEQAIIKLAKDQYRQIFAKQVAEADGKSYAYICYDQDAYGAVYWSWRAIKHLNKKGYQYGNALSTKELNAIYDLATNPVDNVQSTVNTIKNEQEFISFFSTVWRVYRRFNRKWYQHPRWHINHWSIQFHPFQRLKRRYWDKCSVCGKRGFKGSAHGNWNGDKIWHQECDQSITPIKDDKN